MDAFRSAKGERPWLSIGAVGKKSRSSQSILNSSSANPERGLISLNKGVMQYLNRTKQSSASTSSRSGMPRTAAASSFIAPNYRGLDAAEVISGIEGYKLHFLTIKHVSLARPGGSWKTTAGDDGQRGGQT
jgi:hypothetical protein